MKLSSEDKIRLTRYYEAALLEHGSQSAQALRWKNEENQRVRFGALCQVADPSNQSVLDVGSGLGDLYPFLQSRFTNIAYTGIDFVPGMVALAKEKYPEADFLQGDILDYHQRYDYVLASGALTFNVSGGKEFYFKIMEHMYSLARKGVAFNVLDSSYYDQDENYLVYSYEEVVEVCSRLGAHYAVTPTDEVGDFTVFLYKD